MSALLGNEEDEVYRDYHLGTHLGFLMTEGSPQTFEEVPTGIVVRTASSCRAEVQPLHNLLYLKAQNNFTPSTYFPFNNGLTVTDKCCSMSEFKVLERLFVIENKLDVFSFLNENSHLEDVLVFASSKIKLKFPDSKIILRLTTDKELSSERCLIAFIEVETEPEDALPIILDMGHDWLNEKIIESNDMFFVSLEYV